MVEAGARAREVGDVVEEVARDEVVEVLLSKPGGRGSFVVS